MNPTKITDNQDEMPVGELFQSNTQHVIPYFQREFVWTHGKHIDPLERDIVQVSEEESLHFLGVILLLNRPEQGARGAGTSYVDVIDGQQRLTVMYLYILAVANYYAKNNDIDEAVSIFQTYLVNRKDKRTPETIKLNHCGEDRPQLKNCFETVLKNADLRTKLGSDVPIYPPIDKRHPEKGRITKVFSRLRKFIDETHKQRGGEIGVRKDFESFLTSFYVVRLEISDPLQGPVIFERLNSRGEKIKTVDLIRNEVFARSSSSLAEMQETYEDHWVPLIEDFKDEEGTYDWLEKYFFPIGLINNPQLVKANIFSELRRKWEKIKNSKEIIESISEYKKPYLTLVKQENILKLSPKVFDKLECLLKANCPTTTYPFLIRVLVEIEKKKIGESDSIEIFELLESFFVRRAICGLEPSGLHAVFKEMWGKCLGACNAKTVRSIITHHSTVPWPNDHDFEQKILTENMYQKRICNYVLEEYDKSLGSDSPANKFEIEHIVPQTIAKKSQWAKDFNKDKHEEIVNTWANLIVISSSLNKGVGCKDYDEKKSKYADKSMYESPRHIAKKYKTWTVKDLEKRAAELVAFSLKRWSH